MSSYRRNVLVGITVMVAMLMLGWMIVQFGARLAVPFQGEQRSIQFVADRADGISIGSLIKYKGIQVGTVKAVTLDIEKDIVTIDSEFDANRELPANLVAEIRIPNLLGAAAMIDLKLSSREISAQRLTSGQVIQATYSGAGIFPPELIELTNQMKLSVEEFRRAGTVQKINALSDNLNEQVTKAGQTLDSINQVIGSEAAQADLKTIIAQVRDTSDRVNNVATNLEKLTKDLETLPADAQATLADVRSGVNEGRATIANANQRVTQLSDQINRQLDQVGRIFDDARSITNKINVGQGTIGKLLNDPRLYETLVDATQLLQAVFKDTQRVVQQIEQEGFAVKLR